jgi:hypothetical protein
MHPVRGRLGLARRDEDDARIISENSEPGGDIGGMVGTRMMSDAEVGQDIAGRQLRNGLLDRQGFAPEPLAEIPVEAMAGSCRMGSLM